MPACYLLLTPDEIALRAAEARRLLSPCAVCPRACRVDRLGDERGYCQTGRLAKVASYAPHFGEEPPLSGHAGSGTIFFAGCNLGCIFCQNHDISHGGIGDEVTDEQLARMMLRLQRMGCHNINLVSPTHVVPQILDALAVAVAQGLEIPIVYNTGGYDSMALLRLLDGIVDIYMPDAKYSDEDVARRLSDVDHYVRVNRIVLREMQRQVGDLKMDARGIASRGLLVRHLVLPGGLAGSENVLEFIATALSRNAYVNVMAQYRPCFRAHQEAPLNRRPTPQEHAQALEAARRHGLTRALGI